MTEEPLVDLILDHPGWETALPELEEVATLAATLALGAVGLEPERVTIALLACDDDRIAALNGDFRGKAQPTNVLSWPAEDLAPAEEGGLPRLPRLMPGMRQPLGDVAIALQTTRAEAEAAAIPLKQHVIHLILHGCLHLLGFDHETEADASRMEGLESRLLIGIGIADPYSRGEAAPPGAPG